MCIVPRCCTVFRQGARLLLVVLLLIGWLTFVPAGHGEEAPATFAYENKLVPLSNPAPLLADYPEYVEPLREVRRLEAPPLIDDADGQLSVRAWRYSYNARGIVEMDNRLDGASTALIVVHPWGIDDGGGWQTPEPAGVALFCTPEKNEIYLRHIAEVVNPLVARLRPHVNLVAYSLPGRDDPIRRKCYRSYNHQPDAAERQQGFEELDRTLRAFEYRANPLDRQLMLDPRQTTASYFRAFSGLDSSDKFNGPGFWKLPIPVVRPLEVDPRDVVIYDALGYEPLRDFLRSQGVRHVLLAGYATDMCLCSTTAGYENLGPDFNVFVVGDATLATFPASQTPRFATQASLCKASLTNLVSQVSWIRHAAERAEAR